jgi:DnaK suppressor protein
MTTITAKQQDVFRNRLTQERARIQGDLDSLGAEIATLGSDQQSEGSSAGNHMADGATDIAEQERDLALIGTLQDRMRDVDRALERLEAGTYGVCERCGEEIAPERLEVRPFATFCVNCQSQADRQRRPAMA